jgi:SAM-dependent methyltransferase
VIGELYEHALAGRAEPEIEHTDGTRMPLPVENWLHARPGDASIVDRCAGPTLDVGSGPGRLTVALAERGIPVLGIDVTPYAVRVARAAGALTLVRDVFGQVPGAGRWMTVLLADGNIGIGGDPVALLRRVAELMGPLGRALVEVQPPGTELRKEQVRLRAAGKIGAWFPWAYVGADQIAEVAEGAGMMAQDTWTADGRWFASLYVPLTVAAGQALLPARYATLRYMSTTTRAAIRWTALLGCLAILGGLTFLLSRRELYQAHVERTPLVLAAFVAFGVAAWLVRKVALKVAVGLILVAGITFQALAFTAVPTHSSDMYRYMWDGRVQAAGIDPYLYAPPAAALAPLRNDYLWGPYSPKVNAELFSSCTPSAPDKADPASATVGGCTKLNRVGVHTIYPPVAEAWFTAVYLIAGDNSPTPMQVSMALCAVLTTLVLLFGLRKLKRDPRLAALWAWCPAVILEVGNDAHSDVLGILLTAIALLVLARARTEGKAMLGGALLGLALATKLTPAFVFPGVLKRAWQHILVAAGAATIIVYAPHVMTVGSKVIGFFPGYIKEQGYSDGSGYRIIGHFAHGTLASLVALAVLGIVALAVLRFSNPDQPWRGGVVMTSAALVVGTPEFEWYSLLLVMLVALDGRAEWLALTAGAYVANNWHLTPTMGVPHARALGYGGGLAIALAVTGIRLLHARLRGARLNGARLNNARRAVSLPAIPVARPHPVTDETSEDAPPPYRLLTGAAIGERSGS